MANFKNDVARSAKETAIQRNHGSTQLVAIILLIRSQREDSLLSLSLSDVLGHDVSSCQGKSHLAIRNHRMLDQSASSRLWYKHNNGANVPHRTSATPLHA